MTPEYLLELADIADPEQLWRLSGIDQMNLSEDSRNKMLMGVALRRHAEHVRRVNELRGTGKSLVITPLSIGGTAVMSIDAPEDHRRLLDMRNGK